MPVQHYPSVTAEDAEDDIFDIFDDDDPTKKARFEVSDVSPSTTRVINVPDSDVDLTDIGTQATAIGLNTTHRGSVGTDHSDVGLANTHRGSAGTDHSDVGLNNTHRGSNGTDHANVALNDTHRGSAGTDHADVGLNNTHRTGNGADHADVATNTTALTKLDPATTATVATSGGDYTSILTAVTAVGAGGTVLVYPGTYTETVTFPANNITIRAMGGDENCIITQADANVIDFNTRTGIHIFDMTISVTAATSAIANVTGSTGDIFLANCGLDMTSSAAIVAASQPCLGKLTGAGMIKVIDGTHTYTHTGACGGTAQKGAFVTANGGTIDLDKLHELTISNSGAALVSSISLDLASSGNVHMTDCTCSVTDPDATLIVGLGYIGGTGTSHEFIRNDIHVVATNNTAYGFFAGDTASSTKASYNHLHVTDAAGASYAFFVNTAATATSSYDEIIAADGNVIAGTFTYYARPIDASAFSGNLSATDVNSQLAFDTLDAMTGGTYDVIVDAAGGGDYTTVAAGLAGATANKSIFVTRGTYAETTDPIALNGQNIHFDHVVMNLAVDQKLQVSNDDITITGNLTLAGKGDSALTYRIIESVGDRNDLSGCLIKLDPDYSDAHAGAVYCAALGGNYNNYKIYAKDIAATTTSTYATVITVGTHNTHNIKLEGIATTNASSHLGLFSQGDYSDYVVSIQNITDDTANLSDGVDFFAGSNYNSITGSCRDCDGANLDDNGTGNKTGELATV